MLFNVDFLITNKEGFESDKKTLPVFIVCDDFDTAVKIARKYETPHTTLIEVKPTANHNNIVVARGFKGLSLDKESA